MNSSSKLLTANTTKVKFNQLAVSTKKAIAVGGISKVTTQIGTKRALMTLNLLKSSGRATHLGKLSK